MGVTTERVWGLWSPVLSGVLFDTDKKPYVKEIKKIQVNKANPNGHVAMRWWWSILLLAVQFPLKSNDLLWPYFLDLYLIQYFFHTHTSFNWSGFFSILHLIYISCFIMSPELRRGELNLQLIFNYFQNQWHPGSLHSDLLIIFFLVWNKFSPNNS